MEPPENNNEKVFGLKSRVKFKIMSLKVNGPMDYVPELVNITSPFASFVFISPFELSWLLSHLLKLTLIVYFFIVKY